MNFYPMHIGDYASATLHLSCTEDLFFRRMLDLYYTHEKPLPADQALLCRKLRAAEPAQRDAVRAVLKEFFERTPEGWRQKRCDREIANSEQKRVAASQSANLRWHGQAEGATAPPGKGRVASRARPRKEALPGANAEPTAEPPADADAMRTHATALPTHADALPPQCEGNATNTNPNPTTTTNPSNHTATAPPAAAVDDAAADAAVAATTQADVPIPDPPQAVADWLNFFRREGFDGKPMASPLLRQQAQRWVERRVTLAVMREAMADARARLNGPPGSPRYYAWAVDAVMQARELAQAHAAPGAAAGTAPPGPPPPPAAAYAGNARYGLPESI